MVAKCTKCNDTGAKIDFASGIGPYLADCECHRVCPICQGTGVGKPGFAQGIGPYSTDCLKCSGSGRIRK